MQAIVFRFQTITVEQSDVRGAVVFVVPLHRGHKVLHFITFAVQCFLFHLTSLHYNSCSNLSHFQYHLSRIWTEKGSCVVCRLRRHWLMPAGRTVDVLINSLWYLHAVMERIDAALVYGNKWGQWQRWTGNVCNLIFFFFTVYTCMRDRGTGFYFERRRKCLGCHATIDEMHKSDHLQSLARTHTAHSSKGEEGDVSCPRHNKRL